MWILIHYYLFFLIILVIQSFIIGTLSIENYLSREVIDLSLHNKLNKKNKKKLKKQIKKQKKNTKIHKKIKTDKIIFVIILFIFANLHIFDSTLKLDFSNIEISFNLISFTISFFILKRIKNAL